jgi:hypothetical protein
MGLSVKKRSAKPFHFIQRRRLCIALLGVILLGVSEGFSGLAAYAQGPAFPLKATPKDPKLCSLLRDLRDEVPQGSQPLTQTQQMEPSRTFSVEKLSKPIVDAVKARQMRINQDAEVQVYIKLNNLSDENVQALRTLGIKVQIIGKPIPDRGKAEVLTTVPTLQALLPVTMIEQVEELPFVRYLRLPDYAMSSTASVESQGDVILNASDARTLFNVDGTGVHIGVISSGIGGIFPTGCTSCTPSTTNPNTPNPNPILLEDLPIATGTRNSAETLISVSGGITAAMSYRSDLDLEDKADVPPFGAEGTALLEVIHDLAPGAALSFTNSETAMEFEQAVDALAATNDVVVDDQVFPSEPSFDGTSDVSTNTEAALNNSSNQIRAYITSAGNFALNHYQGTYQDSMMDGSTITGQPGDLHQFQAATGVTTDNESFGPIIYDPVITIPSLQQVQVYLVWNDPVGASTNDYDLFLVPLSCGSPQNGLPTKPCSINTNVPIVSGNNPQTGTQDPVESLTFTNNSSSPVTYGIVIQNVKNLASAVTFDLFITGYGAEGNLPNHNFNTVAGSIPAQSDAGDGVLSVGAINEIQCPVPETCTGLLESFSSQGPLQVTPQVSTPTVKPNLVAVDEVCIDGAGGFGSPLPSDVNCPVAPSASDQPNLYPGTSAAAAHVAAIAALVLQSAPCLLSDFPSPLWTPAQSRSKIQVALESKAQLVPRYASTQTPSNGYNTVQNNEDGYGLVDALTSVMSMLPTAMVPVTFTVPSAPPGTVATTGTQTVSATSQSGAPILLTGTGTDPNNCPIAAIQWSGTCGAGTLASKSATVECPIGVNTVQLSISNNTVSFTPLPATPVLTITVTDFTMSASMTSGNGIPGTPNLYTIIVAPTAQEAFSNPVSLACSSGLPPGAVCYFSPSSVTPGATSAISTLTIITPAVAPFNRKAPWIRPNLKAPSLWYGIVIALIVMAIWTKTSKRKLGFRFALGAFLVFLAVSPVGCGSNSTTSTSTTPAPTTYTVTVTGTSNQLQRTTTVSLAVQ